MNKEQDDSKMENGGVFHFISLFQGDQAAEAREARVHIFNPFLLMKLYAGSPFHTMQLIPQPDAPSHRIHEPVFALIPVYVANERKVVMAYQT